MVVVAQIGGRRRNRRCAGAGCDSEINELHVTHCVLVYFQQHQPPHRPSIVQTGCARLPAPASGQLPAPHAIMIPLVRSATAEQLCAEQTQAMRVRALFLARSTGVALKRTGLLLSISGHAYCMFAPSRCFSFRRPSWTSVRPLIEEASMDSVAPTARRTPLRATAEAPFLRWAYSGGGTICDPGLGDSTSC